MTDATQFDMPAWPMDNLLDQQTLASQDLSPHPFIAGDFPLAFQEELDPVWSEQFNWNEYTPKTNTLQPYPQLWYEAGLVRQDIVDSSPNSIPLQPNPNSEHPPVQPRSAAERALFMTPSPSMAFPFPTSPVSDPLSPTSSSHASAWEEGDRDREEGLYAGTFGNGMGLNAHSQGQGQGHAPAHPSPRRYSEHSSHTIDEEDVLTPLEMPDGSTRFTSNWLPVDPGAGFTIGSGMPGYGDEMHFGNMQNAFFPSKPTASAWGFDR